ncbi:YrhB domain-containing protein [Streptomyces sp. CCM_MD2014]|uniref:YrhB domain-containing protein n=1 Tax=Streptomyces sp. CCM_MD2014 TaxID=1561022 RepID=UPI00099B7B21|nr:YrhB domain-containing protein [Streptomyces sp. CCM_MD2014]MDA4886262.1 YrhB domain-containing protein [Streptomyces sp. MS2A]
MPGPDQAATAWLNATYGGLVQLTVPHPVHETSSAWLMACRPLPQPGYPETPMMTASVVVPKDGSAPFHPAPSAPLADLEPAPPREAAARAEHQARRVNARGCVIALHSAIGGAPSVALPWKPADEAPGWWDRLTRRYFPEFARVPVNGWDDVVQAVAEPGPDTRGVVWVRRAVAGHEATGHLLYAHNNKGQVVLLDPLTSALARLDDPLVRELVLVRALPGALTPRRAGWERAAPDFAAAVDKARHWLRGAYGGAVELHAPTAEDETTRGWVFSCNTTRFLRDGNWSDAMLDATVVVPKDESAPFGLPNTDPWTWLARWDAGTEPGTAGLEQPPAPAHAAWFEPTLAELGPVLSVSEHQDFAAVMEAADALPVAARALIWARRTDGRGREAVGRLLNVLRLESGVMVVDGSSGDPVSFDPTGVHRLHLIRYR